MPLFIRDDAVDALAREVQLATKAKSKTEAVRIALEHELERTRRARPLRERIAAAMAIADSLGPGDPDFDMKAFTDEMWGED
jgi:antitoxin VapB